MAELVEDVAVVPGAEGVAHPRVSWGAVFAGNGCLPARRAKSIPEFFQATPHARSRSDRACTVPAGIGYATRSPRRRSIGR